MEEVKLICADCREELEIRRTEPKLGSEVPGGWLIYSCSCNDDRYENGYEDGCKDGHDEGYDDGYDDGYDGGYDEGYQKGRKDGSI